MYRIANIVLFVLAIFVVMGCSCSKTLCERNIQDDILNIDKFRKQSKKEYRYIEEDAKRLFANSAAVYSDTLYRQQYTSLQGYFYGETGFDNYKTPFVFFIITYVLLYKTFCSYYIKRKKGMEIIRSKPLIFNSQKVSSFISWMIYPILVVLLYFIIIHRHWLKIIQ